MNKRYIGRVIAISILALFASCAKNEIELEIATEGGTPTVNIPFQLVLNTDEPKTRTVNDGMSTKWAVGDEVNVFHAVSGQTDYINDGKFTITDVENGVFQGTLASAVDADKSYDWYVSYPYSENLTTPDNSDTGYSLVAPLVQTQDGNDSKEHLAELALVGKGTSAPGNTRPNVSMKQTASVIKVVVTNNSGSDLPISYIRITTAANTELAGHSIVNIAGSYYINFTDPANLVYNAASGASTSVSLNASYTIPNSGSNTGVFYIAVNPFMIQKDDVLKLRVNNYEKVITLPSDKTFTVANINTFNFNYSQPWVAINDVVDAGLPILYIETINREEPTFEIAEAPVGMAGAGIKNATKIPGRVFIEEGGVKVFDSGEYVKKSSGMTVKIRGNTSAYAAKKPYKIKLESKADMLGRGDSKYQDKNWILVKDESLKYKIGFKINELVGLQWTPSYKYVNVVFNGEYRGLYMLLESVERNTDCRLNVKKTGYIFELDAYWWNEDRYFASGFDPKMNYTYKFPDTDDLTEEQNTYISTYIADAEASLQDGTYPNYIDIESFALWMLGHDILGNTDGAGSNWFFTKYDNTDGSKVMLGPLWDFDAIMNSSTWDSAHMRYWFSSLFNNVNKAFVHEYKQKWAVLRPTIFDDLTSHLSTFAASEEGISFNNSIVLDNTRWSTSNNSVSERVDNANSWFANRATWLDYRINLLDDSE